jgi:protoporphyrinogen IX oxidase
MIDVFLWLKAAHVVAVFAWMAGLFYLPRLFVYHVAQVRGSASDVMLQTMERRLLKAIMNPAVAASWIFGVVAAWTGGWFEAFTAWLWLKIALVGLLTVFHLFLARCQRAFAAGSNRYPEKFYRIINEVPTLLLIGIVILVVVKPFA